MAVPDRGRERTEAAPREQPAAAPRRDELAALASTVGNAAMVRIARDGAGLLPNGRVAPAVEAAIHRRRGGGRALDPAARKVAAARLGDPLDDVRIHDDPASAGLARAVSAHAFTTGNDVFFDHGQYRPHTTEGRRLLMHELTHVVQQRGAPRSGPLHVTDPGDALEAEAEAIARDSASG